MRTLCALDEAGERIADLNNAERVSANHVAEAVQSGRPRHEMLRELSSRR